MKLFYPTSADPRQYTKEEDFPFFGKNKGSGLTICAYQVRNENGDILVRYHNAPCFATADAIVEENNAKSIDLSLYITKECRLDAAKAWFDYLLVDKRSLFRSLHDKITYTKDDDDFPLYVNIKTPDSSFTPDMLALSIGLRHTKEHPSRVNLFHTLVTKGVDPRTAFLSSFYFVEINGAIIESKSGSGHYMFGSNTHLPSFKAFFKGELQKTNPNHDSWITSEYVVWGDDRFPKIPTQKNKKDVYTGVFETLRNNKMNANPNSVEHKVDQLVEQLNDKFKEWTSEV